jgi:hypothetical protein
MGKFELINPILAGNINTTFEENTPLKAAENFWNMFTKEKQLVVNELHHFMFTLRDENGKMSHFSVHEKKNNNEVEYSLEDVTKSVEQGADKNMMGQFIQEVDKVKAQISGQSGGKKQTGAKRDRTKDLKKDDSSSSSDSDSDDEFDFDRLRRRMYTTPISYWWYSPLIYRVRRIYTPVFVKPLAPYVQLWLPMR